MYGLNNQHQEDGRCAVNEWKEGKILYTESGKAFLFVEMQNYPRPKKKIRVEDIIRTVSRFYKISRDRMLSPGIGRKLVRPRQIAMYIAKTLTGRSLPEIGRCFRRDHTTVLDSVRKVKKMILENNDFKIEVESLIQYIRDGFQSSMLA